MENEKDLQKVDNDLAERVYLSNLYDFYGDLLKDNQKTAFEAYMLEDLSLSEIAGDLQISRQGVYDLVKRACRQLKGFEEKIHLVERFHHVKGRIEDLERRMQEFQDLPAEECSEIRSALSQILEEI